MANLSKPLNQGFAAPSIVANYGPYESVAAAHDALADDGLNVVGMTVGIGTNNTIVEYWYQGGTAQANLVKKQNDEDVLRFTEIGAIVSESFIHESTNDTPDGIRYCTTANQSEQQVNINTFLAAVNRTIGGMTITEYYRRWKGYEQYIDATNEKPYYNKIYLLGGSVYVWNGEELVVNVDVVSTKEQTLTNEQQTRALTNISAIGYQEQELNDNQKVQAQNNIQGKEYNAESFSGLGKKVLEKNIQTVDNVEKNILTQDMFYTGAVGSRIPNTNTVFVIQYDYELGENITVPANCVLEFDGGSITASGNNDTITGSNTRIEASTKKIFASNVTLSGSFIDFCIDWLLDDNESDVAPFVNKVWTISNSITFKKENYSFRSEAKVHGSIYAPNSKFTMYGNGCLVTENTKSTEVSIAFISINVKEISGTSNYISENTSKGLLIRSLSFSDIKIYRMQYFTDCCVLIETGNKTIDGVLDTLNREVVSNNFCFEYLINAPVLVKVRALENGWVNDNKFIDIHLAGGEYKHDRPLGANNGMIWENPTTYSYNHNIFHHILFEGVEGTLIEFNKATYNVIDFIRYEKGTDNSKIIFKNKSHSNIIQNVFYDIKNQIDDNENNGVVFGEYKSTKTYGLINILNANPISAWFEQFVDNNVNKIRPINEKLSIYKGSTAVPQTSAIATISAPSITIGDNSGAILIGCEINTQENKVVYINHADSPTRSIHVRYLEVNNTPVGTDMKTQTAPMLRSNNDSINAGSYNDTFKTFYFDSVQDGTLFVPSSVTKIAVYLVLSTGNTISSLNIYGATNDVLLGKSHRGSTTDRPTIGVVGFKYFDTTLGKPIYWNGSAWVDATGVSA